MCSLKLKNIEIELPDSEEQRAYIEQSIQVGHFTAFQVYPTCGIATKEKVIGQFDDPRYFLDPERVNAAILWFGKGYVEYKIPNYLRPDQKPSEIQISLEIASEAPGVSDNWPSDIHFYMNDMPVGFWTSPGDFGGNAKGRFTPDWWSKDINQYGLWKVIRITTNGTYIDGIRISDRSIMELQLNKPFWTIRFSVEDTSEHVGGMTLYGAGFGNYNQDIQLRVYYEKET